jgi:hypothetical protein
LFCRALRANVGAFAAESGQAPGGSKPGGKPGQRRVSMKNQTLIVASLCVVIGLAVVPAYAQRGGVEAKVPFNFAVSGKIFPAGDYTMIASSHQLKIEDAGGKIVAMVLVNNVSGHSAAKKGQIIFHCYRERCFLAEVWSAVQENGSELLRSRAEANLAREEQGKYFAILGQEPVKGR